MAVVVVASANYNIVQRVFKVDNDRFDFESSCTTNSGSGNRWYGQMLLTKKKQCVSDRNKTLITKNDD